MPRRRKTRKRPCQLQTRDIQLIFFLWKWKVSTTALLTARFFPDVAPSTAYRRLWTLATRNVLASRFDPTGRKHVWMLDKHGFEVVKSRLSGKLAEFGYKSEHVGHDLLAQAFHLGDWALGAPDGFRLFSEQQIRRMDKDDWPAWVPTIRHRPDGWIHNAKTAETFAIEVEISAKHSLKYGGIYSCSGHNRKQLTGVLWLTPSATVARRILKHLIKWEVNGAPHHFFDFESFKKLGWGAQVIVGQNEGMTIREILEQHPQNSPPTSSQHDVTQLCLNMVKTPFRSKGCRLYEIGDFGN